MGFLYYVQFFQVSWVFLMPLSVSASYSYHFSRSFLPPSLACKRILAPMISNSLPLLIYIITKKLIFSEFRQETIWQKPTNLFKWIPSPKYHIDRNKLIKINKRWKIDRIIISSVLTCIPTQHTELFNRKV